MTTVTKQDIYSAIEVLGIAGKPICIHSSLSSFGKVEGGARTVIDGFIDKGCTALVPTFTYDYTIAFPKDKRPARNGCVYRDDYIIEDKGKIFTERSNDISWDSLGRIPYELLRYPDRERGYHPINSFAALGSLAKLLVLGQTETNVYAPFKALAELDGYIILMGVDLTKMTAIHYAEQLSGRTLFVQYANGRDGKPIPVSVGSCSEGFNNLEQPLSSVESRMTVGNSLWRIYPAKTTIEIATRAILQNQSITHCDDLSCQRCNDAVAGGRIS